MKNNTKMERREFIKGTVSSSLALILGTAYLITGCNNSGKQTEKTAVGKSQGNAVSSCDDYSGVDEVNLRKREQLGYVKQTPNPEHQCDNCKLYIAPKDGQPCGGCMLFTGPVFAEGYCTYWAPPDEA